MVRAGGLWLRRWAAPHEARGVRIGVSLNSQWQAHAVGVLRGRVVWTMASPLDASTALDVTLAAFLADVVSRARRDRRPWRRRASVGIRVAMPAALAQVKRVAGLPETGDVTLLRRVLQQGASRFFVCAGHTIRVGRVRRGGDGVVWAVAFDAEAVARLNAACHAAGARLLWAMPASEVLPSAIEGSPLLWHDGAWQLELHVAGGRVVEVRRVPSLPTVLASVNGVLRQDGALQDGGFQDGVVRYEDGHEQHDRQHVWQGHGMRCVPALAELGQLAASFAAAYGAAVVPAAERLSLEHSDISIASSEPSRWRLAVAMLAATVAIASALAIAPARDQRAANVAREELGRMATRRSEAAAVERELRRTTVSLVALDDFVAARRSTTALLAGLSDALPDRSALLSLRVDSTGGTAVTLARRSAAVVEAIRTVPGLLAPELVGPVTRERRGQGGQGGLPGPSSVLPPAVGGTSMMPPAVGVEELERATVRFRFERGGKSPARSAAGGPRATR